MHFAVWGISFKPNTDDIREAPSLELINSLIKHGATVSAYDPVATNNAAEHYMSNNSITFTNSSMEALNNADALVIMTEWQEFRAPNFYEIKERLKMPIIFDGRNLYKPEELIQNEIEYQCIGRP
jgi:UDPglucose 6-dehydrogenase